MPSPEVQKLLDRHKSLVLDEGTQKVKCSLTNHEMPAKVDAIETYLNGKKYKRLAELDALVYEDHKKHIVPSFKKKKENEMFCRLTLRHLEKTAKAIQLHINGRKYKNALVRWDECKKNGTKFVAHIRRKPKRPDESDDESVSGDGSVVEDDSIGDSDNEDNEEDDDDMDDLYPEADFQDVDIPDADMEGDVEEDDSVTTENVPPSTGKGSKKQKNNKGKKKGGEKTNKKGVKSKGGKDDGDTASKSQGKSKNSASKKRSAQQNGKEPVVKKKIKA